MFRPVLVLLLLAAAPALAWPVDMIQDVEAGKVKFIRLPGLDFFEVQDPGIATVEWMSDSGELLITAKKAGRTNVLLGAGGKVAVWRIRVSQKPVVDAEAKKAAQKACADFKDDPLGEVKLTVTVATPACRAALLKLFESDTYIASDLQLTYATDVLQGQLKTMQAAFEAAGIPVESNYLGAGLELKGKLTVAQHHQVLWEAFHQSLGRLPLNDFIVETDAAPPDAGAKKE